MRFEKNIAEGERDHVLARHIGCEVCGFVEVELKTWQDGDQVQHVHCEECFNSIVAPDDGDLITAYLPELPLAVTSHLLRSLVWAQFAKQTGHCNFDALCEGYLPRKFNKKKRWFRVSADLNQVLSSEHRASRLRMTTLLADTTSFFKNRLEYTASICGTTHPSTVREKLGEDDFLKNYRVISNQISVDRVRTWHNGTFPVQAEKGV